MASHTRRDVSWLILLVLGNTLPFVNRAIHLDENTYLAIAHHVFQNFLFPQDFPGMWFGIPVLNWSGHTHPVGLAWFLAAIMEIFRSDREWMLRLGFTVFPLTFAVATYFLARRFTRHPFMAALLTMVTPAVLVFSPVLMPDLPMATFWLLAAVAFVHGLDREKSRALWAAGLLLIAATLVSYQALFMSVVLSVYAWARGDRRPRTYVPLLLPFLFLALYWYAGYRHYGFFAAERSQKYLSGYNIFGLEYFRQKLLGMFTTLGATTVFGLAALWIWWRSKGWIRAAAGLILVLASLLLVPHDYTLLEKAEYFLFALSGLALVWIVAGDFFEALLPSSGREPGSRADTLFMSTWVLGIIGYTVVLCEFSATRYYSALVPPLVILIVRHVESVLDQQTQLKKAFFQFAIITTWVLALIIAFADYQFVGAYRSYAQWLSKRHSGSEGTVWVGTEAGLRYYMEREGARTLVNRDAPEMSGVLPGPAWGEAHFGRPAVGDLLVRPRSFLRYNIAQNLELSAVIDSRILRSSFPVRTYGPESHAGLHGTNVGLLPFAISRAPLDQIELSRYTVFAADFEKARKEAPAGGGIAFGYMKVQGEMKEVILMPPQSRLVYSMAVPAFSIFQGKWGVDDSQVLGTGCRPTVKVSLERSTGLQGVECTGNSNLSFIHRSLSGEFYCFLDGPVDQPIGLAIQAAGMTGESGHCPAMGLWDLNLTPVAKSH